MFQMRKQTAILLFLLILCVGLLLFVTPPAQKQPPAIRSANSSLLDPIRLPAIPVLSGSLPKLSGNTDSQDTFLERMINEQLPALLADKEGSYTRADELYQNDKPFSIDVQSDWAVRYFSPETTLPNLSLRIIKNPETGEYESGGGSLTLPGGAWEAGYELDPESGERKATLQWKKSF